MDGAHETLAKELARMLGRIGRYFFEGMLLLAPLAATVYVLYLIVAQFDFLLTGWHAVIWAAIGISFITLIGYLASNYFAKKALSIIEEIMLKVPFVKLVYTSIKDLTVAFMSDRKKVFNRPVGVRFTKDSEVLQLGFVTDEAMEKFGLGGMVCVYLPFSYSIAGRVVLVPADHVKPLDAPGGDVMAFIVSGGLTTTGIERKE